MLLLLLGWKAMGLCCGGNGGLALVLRLTAPSAWQLSQALGVWE